MTDSNEKPGTTWTVDRLIQFAQTMDAGRQYQSPNERISKRQLAFGARKFARTKISRRTIDHD